MRRLACFILPCTLLVSAGSDVTDRAKVAPQPLWAGMSVNRPLFDLRPRIAIPGEESQHIVLFFNLVNDSDKTIDTQLRESQLFINGEEFKDWEFSLSNGLQDSRRAALPAGEFLSFAYQMDRHFQNQGVYRVVWKGKKFQSREIEFRVLAAKPE